MTNDDARKAREEARHSTSLTVQIRSPGRRCYGTMYDISPHGAFVAIDSPPGRGARLQVAIRLADGSDLVLSAEVRYSTSDDGARLSSGVGLKFLDLAEEQREEILRIVDRLKRGANARGTEATEEE